MNITETLGLKLPLFQAPLTAYPNQSQLVTAVSNEGGLGVYSTAFQTLDEISGELANIQSQTDKPYGVVIDVDDKDTEKTIDLADRSQVNGYLQSAYQTLKVDAHATASLPSAVEVMRLVSDYRPKVVIFQNGLPSDALLKLCDNAGVTTMALVSNTLEAIAAEHVVDMMVLQGIESAGILSRFNNDLNAPFYPVNTLLHQVIANVDKPLIVWGDYQFPQHVVAALINGASAAMVDALYWTTKESPIPNSYRKALTQHTEMQTAISTVWSGQPAQTLKNTLTNEAPQSVAVLPSRQQQCLILPIIKAAIAQDNADYMPMWAGLCAVNTDTSVADLSQRFSDEINEIVS